MAAHLPLATRNGIYITGGKQKPLGLRAREEWVVFERGLILRADPERGLIERCLDYVTPDEACAQDSSITFEGGVLQDGRLYTCTRTEALVFSVPEFALLSRVSLPCFNDIHHVRPSKDGNLIVTNTGLDMVVETTLDGDVVREWGVLGESPWIRFSRDVDYRKVLTTKPHASHPNFTFFIGDELWVTRCMQQDAVSLTKAGRRIDVGFYCHDGEMHEGKIYFTTVTGTVVIVDAETLQTEGVVNLNEIDNPGKANLGWCRGLARLDERHLWVGFTRIRETRFKENVRWVKRLIKGEEKPTHIALYDVVARKRLLEIDLEPFDMHVIFGVFSTGI
ncbi:MAG: hypothetical protein WAK16_12450 [Candidatus Cybelea sp.]